MTVAASNVIALPTEDLVLVTPGEYDCFYVGHKGKHLFQAPKLRVDFQLAVHPELIVSRWYGVKDYRGGYVRAGRHSDLARELQAVLGRRLRTDRLPVGDLAELQVRVAIRTVTKDSHQRELVAVNQYSVVERMLGRVQ